MMDDIVEMNRSLMKCDVMKMCDRKCRGGCHDDIRKDVRG